MFLGIRWLKLEWGQFCSCKRNAYVALLGHFSFFVDDDGAAQPQTHRRNIYVYICHSRLETLIYVLQNKNTRSNIWSKSIFASCV